MTNTRLLESKKNIDVESNPAEIFEVFNDRYRGILH